MNRNRIEDMKEYDELKAALQSVKAVEEMLRQTATASDAVTRLNDMVNKRTLYALPDDILAAIFEMAHEDNDGATRSFSLVSRRFNRIALKLPILW